MLILMEGENEMAYGIFRAEEHIYTMNNEFAANDLSKRLGIEYYVRELTPDEWFERMKEIYIEGKYK